MSPVYNGKPGISSTKVRSRVFKYHNLESQQHQILGSPFIGSGILYCGYADKCQRRTLIYIETCVGEMHKI
jgi:hypothetical protein